MPQEVPLGTSVCQSQANAANFWKM